MLKPIDLSSLKHLRLHLLKYFDLLILKLKLIGLLIQMLID